VNSGQWAVILKTSKMMSETKTDIEGLRSRISGGATTARAVVESSVNSAEKLNESLNAFLEIDAHGAPKRAEAIAALDGALAGIPFAVKDNLCVEGMQTSCGSRILGNYHPPYNATVIERLLGSGAVVIGKTN
jgi:aspartyl-tRNA(Asn)/glutamyl-tRNA(Gln) amidotransferase subunit A